MSQNIIFPNRDNPIAIEFTFSVPTDPSFGLTGFDEVFVEFNTVTYSSITNPSIVKVVSNTLLEIYLGGEVSSGDIPSYLTIYGVNATYPAPEGYLLTNKCFGNLSAPHIC